VVSEEDLGFVEVAADIEDEKTARFALDHSSLLVKP
jgi:hypothetical protein